MTEKAERPKIYEWTAKRSGPAITVDGTDEKSNDFHKTGITEIVSDGAVVIARHPDGDFELAFF